MTTSTDVISLTCMDDFSAQAMADFVRMAAKQHVDISGSVISGEDPLLMMITAKCAFGVELATLPEVVAAQDRALDMAGPCVADDPAHVDCGVHADGHFACITHGNLLPHYLGERTCR